MTLAGWGQLVALIALIGVTAPLLGRYIANVYEGGPSRLDRFFGPIERMIYRTCRVDAEREQRWNGYALSLLAFSVVGFFLLYLMQVLQNDLPFNPTGMANVTPALSFNTAVSFVTNTNWQSYAGETTMSHFTQMVGLTVQQFVSAAVGMAVMAALIRGLSRAGQRTIGNFWVDLVRTTLRILLPIAFVFAIVLIATGVIQNNNGFTTVHTVAGATQKIPGGPNGSMESIKMLGTNGGDFFNVNSAHPFSNPTKLSDFFELYAILIIPFALAFTFGRMIKDKRQGYAVFAVMFVIWLAASLSTIFLEVGGNSKLDSLGVNQTVTATSPGGNAEGKEVRFGPSGSALWCASTTGTSNGSINSQHDSYTPAGGMVCLAHMKLGEVSPGGVGVGLNGLLVFVILAVFIAGLMVGRTPEYLGKKIQAAEVKLVAIYILVMPAIVLLFIAGSTFVQSVTNTSIYNPGQHGFTELVYAFTSAGNNNGSAFAGITANTAWMNTTLGIVMLFGRFFLIIPTLAIAGSLVRKRHTPASAGTFPTNTPLFVVLVIGVILIVGALTFLPVLALGPLVEQLGL
jgi:K+-transporting ATPase ATPase A chain